MSNCSLCERKITQCRPLYLNTNICSECLSKIRNNDYIIFTNNSDEILDESDDDCDNLLRKSKNGTIYSSKANDDLFIIDASGKEVKVNEEININVEPKLDFCMDNYKDALLASLYSQLDFLKNELDEKNLLIRTLIIKEADVYNYNDSTRSGSATESNNKRVDGSDGSDLDNEDDFQVISSNGSVSEPFVNPNDESLDDDADTCTDEYFRDLYLQFEDDMKENLINQLKSIREEKHHRYQMERVNDIPQETNEEINNISYQHKGSHDSNPNEKWPPNTILIAGDSMINQMDEQRLSHSVNRSVKVRSFSGANVDQMYYYITPLLKKEPKVIILHVGTNDAVTKTSDTILDDILKLKFHIESQLIGVEVVISCPINRIDNSKARLTIKHVINKIKLIKVTKIMNENISGICLGRKGLHLNLRGNGRLAVNLITLMRKL